MKLLLNAVINAFHQHDTRYPRIIDGRIAQYFLFLHISFIIITFYMKTLCHL